MRAVLITGGLGYIGKATAKALEDQGYLPILTDKKIGVSTENIFKIGSLIHILKPVGIIHLSAKKSIGESKKHPWAYYWNNISSTISVFILCRLFNLPVVFASSAAIYSPHNPYAKGKLIEERIISKLSKNVILRYFNIGGQMAGIKDEQSSNIFSIINASVTNGHVFKVNDVNSTRDYIHVKDIGEANLKAIEYLLAGGDSFTTDICSNKQHSVVDILNIYKNNGIKLNVEYSNISEKTIFPEITLGHLLGWKATSTFSDIVQSEIESVEKNK